MSCWLGSVDRASGRGGGEYGCRGGGCRIGGCCATRLKLVEGKRGVGGGGEEGTCGLEMWRVGGGRVDGRGCFEKALKTAAYLYSRVICMPQNRIVDINKRSPHSLP